MTKSKLANISLNDLKSAGVELKVTKDDLIDLAVEKAQELAQQELEEARETLAQAEAKCCQEEFKWLKQKYKTLYSQLCKVMDMQLTMKLTSQGRDTEVIVTGTHTYGFERCFLSWYLDEPVPEYLRELKQKEKVALKTFKDLQEKHRRVNKKEIQRKYRLQIARSVLSNTPEGQDLLNALDNIGKPISFEVSHAYLSS